MFRRLLFLLAAALPPAAAAEAPDAFDLDMALARQSASDLISAAAVGYDCEIEQQSMRKLGTDETAVYLIEVQLTGPECEDALLLLSRHGSTRDFVFRAWEPPTDIEAIDPVAAPEPLDALDPGDGPDE